MEWWWGQGAHLGLTTAVFSENRDIYIYEPYQHSHTAQLKYFSLSRAPAGTFTVIMSRMVGESVWDLPPLFNRRYEVRPRKHGEQTVAIGRRRLIAGAGRVPLIGWPAAVYGLPEDTTGWGVSTVPVILSAMCDLKASQVQIYLMMSEHLDNTQLKKNL